MQYQLGICMGGLACTGLQSRWSWSWPQAKILPPKRHLCLCSGCAGIFVFLHTECLHPKKWIVFRLTLIVNAFSHLSAIFAAFLVFYSWQLHGNFRIALCFTSSHLLLTIFLCSEMVTSDYLPITREGSGPPSGLHHVDITRCTNMFPL